MNAHPLRLHGRTALVVGGGGGVGRGICAELARVGTRIVVAELNPSNADTAMMELQADNRDSIAVVGDARVAEDVDRWFISAEEAFGQVDIVVTCATPPQLLLGIETDNEEYRQAMVDAYVTVPLQVVARAERGMRERGYGRIINVTSEAFALTKHEDTDHAHWVREKALELASSGITVNEVVSGFIPAARHDDIPQEHKDEYFASVPMHRWGSAADVGYACVYFASDEAAFVSGQTLVVNGARALDI